MIQTIACVCTGVAPGWGSSPSGSQEGRTAGVFVPTQKPYSRQAGPGGPGLPSPSQSPLAVEALLQVQEAENTGALRVLIPCHEGRAKKSRGFCPVPSASATQSGDVTPGKWSRDAAQGTGRP